MLDRMSSLILMVMTENKISAKIVNVALEGIKRI